MLIANPIYDVVFKYLMEDERVARLIISTIIDAEIESLRFTPRERTAQIPSLGVTVFHLDFAAVIRTPEGEHKHVLIELQKADGGDDVRRFRRYLAESYYGQANADPGGADAQAPPLPIISVYLLGEPLSELKGYSAVKVKRDYYDAVTGERLPGRNWFVQCLTHDSYVIQLSELKRRRRNRLEQLLALFEQRNLQANRHLKEFTDDLPAEFEPALRRLSTAAADRAVREEMEVEDDVLTAWKRRERQFEEQVEEERRQREGLRQQAIEALMATGMSAEQARQAMEDPTP